VVRESSARGERSFESAAREAWSILDAAQGSKSTRARAVAERLVDVYTALGRTEDIVTWRSKIEQ
jgi:hypothetical protein